MVKNGVKFNRSGYIKTVWVKDETVITANNMNKIEDQLYRLTEEKADKHHTHPEMLLFEFID